MGAPNAAALVTQCTQVCNIYLKSNPSAYQAYKNSINMQCARVGM